MEAKDMFKVNKKVPNLIKFITIFRARKILIYEGLYGGKRHVQSKQKSTKLNKVYQKGKIMASVVSLESLIWLYFNLIHLFPMRPFPPPENIRKLGFLMFLGGKERVNWEQMGQSFT